MPTSSQPSRHDHTPPDVASTLRVVHALTATLDEQLAALPPHEARAVRLTLAERHTTAALTLPDRPQLRLLTGGRR